jgi:nucleoid DNA-binding protein
MLKGDIIDKISGSLEGFLKKDVSQSVDIILDTIAENLAEGGRVEIRGFGSFSVRKRKEKSTKNPKTGKIMNIPSRNTLHFAMSKYLKDPLISASNSAEKDQPDRRVD